MADFDTGLPSIRQIQKWITDKQTVEIKLLTGDTLTGQVVWQDTDCICIADAESAQTVAWRQAIAYHKAV
ncbi:MAG: RNA-binding protein hfq [Cyanobacteria bacterium P01_G01_bin.54]